MPVRGSAGGRETLRRHGVEHFRELGRKGFETFVARYFAGSRAEAVSWLHERAHMTHVERLASEELARRIEAGEKVAVVEVPVLSTEEDGLPF